MEAVNSTGLNFEPEGIFKKYPLLRKSGTSALRLVYYPYWIAEIQGQAKGRWLPARRLTALKAVDAIDGRVYRLLSPPENRLEEVGEARRRAQDSTRDHDPEFPITVLPIEKSSEEAIRAAVEKSLSEWRTRFRRAFAPTASVEVTRASATSIYKPFWIVAFQEEARNPRDQKQETAHRKAPVPKGDHLCRAESSPKSQTLSVAVVDGTTGIAGGIESRQVTRALLTYQVLSPGGL